MVIKHHFRKLAGPKALIDRWKIKSMSIQTQPMQNPVEKRFPQFAYFFNPFERTDCGAFLAQTILIRYPCHALPPTSPASDAPWRSPSSTYRC
uniref:Uncharacterized protein n=1 Tax=Candidatus Kentrum sp. DK TaxID=2126562 RepID=A0A450RY92_9GAMM|nr:MAG: hypothetical protein BECKDK2373C_GA0170839_100760 [Candidatus Kentron sp. DK]